MARIAVFAALAVAMLSVVACDGGGGESADSLVAIDRFDLEEMPLRAEHYIAPPASLLGAYPAVVARVNGAPISGNALVEEQVRLELGRRQIHAYEDMGSPFPQTYIDEQRSENESTDPLAALIDDELLRQAAERLGLLPSHEEAEDLAREAEQAFVGGAEQAENSEGFYEMLRVMGWPDHDWDANERIVETYRRGMGMTRLRKEHCERPTPQPVTALLGFHSGGYDCSAFLAQERENAAIVYYVRWAD